MAVDCESGSLLCIDLSKSLQISWSISLCVLFTTLAILIYRVYLEKNEYQSSVIELNELRPFGNEVTNAMWRALSIGYSLSILLAGMSIDADRSVFFHDPSAKDAIVTLLFLSRIPIAIGATYFVLHSATSTLFKKRLAVSTTANQHNRASGYASFAFFSSVYLMSFFDIAVVKMLPWRATDFTFSYMGYPSSTLLYLCVYTNFISISAQFIAALILLPSSISGLRERSGSYYLSISGSLSMDEILYWLYLAMTLVQFVGSIIYCGMIIHQTLSGKVQRVESKVVDTIQWERLPTEENSVPDDMDAEIEFGTRNPVVSASATAANLSKRNFVH
jgi:hypothetical protein